MALTVPRNPNDESSAPKPQEVDYMMALGVMDNLGRIPANRPPIYGSPEAYENAIRNNPPKVDEEMMARKTEADKRNDIARQNEWTFRRKQGAPAFPAPGRIRNEKKI